MPPEQRAAELVAGGYQVVVEGVVGPWMLTELTRHLPGVDADVHYVVIRPDLATCLARASARAGEEPRVAGNPPLTDSGPIRSLWTQFADLGPLERHVVDSTGSTAEATAAEITRAWAAGELRLDGRPSRQPG